MFFLETDVNGALAGALVATLATVTGLAAWLVRTSGSRQVKAVGDLTGKIGDLAKTLAEWAHRDEIVHIESRQKYDDVIRRLSDIEAKLNEIITRERSSSGKDT